MTALLALLTVLFPSMPGRCFFSSQSPTAVLWVPAENFSNWEEFSIDFAAAGSPGMTIAVTPDQLTAKARRILAPLAADKRVEIAMRINGDPILPLITSSGAAPRPQDALDLLATVRERFQKILNFIPGGYAAGGGAVSPDLFSAFKSMSLQWVAVGNYPRPSPEQWARFSDIVLVPFRPVTADDMPGFASPFSFSNWGPIVIDEADGLAPPGSLLDILSQAAANGTREPWSSVSDAIAKRQDSLIDSSEISDWPTWSTDYSLWNSSGPSQNAWALYSKAALDLEQYQNSGSADLKSLEDATGELHKAQASRFFRLVASTETATAFKADQEFRQDLRTLYKEIDQPSPNALYHSLVDLSSADISGEQAQTDVVFGQGPGWISFQNPPQTMGYVPVSSGAAAAESNSPWKISSLRIAWSTTSVDFSYQMNASTDSLAESEAFNRIVLDTYIDINHIVGAGSTELLPGRNAYTKVADAWEYAVSLDCKSASIYRSSIDGPPELLSQIDVQSDPAKSTFFVSVPQYLMPGNPNHWGYITLSMASQEGSEQESPILWTNPDSSVALSLLAPMEDQQAFFANPLLERLGALRVPLKANPLGLGN